MKIDQHPSQQIQLKCLANTRHVLSCWCRNQLKIKELLIPKYKQPLLMLKEMGCCLKKKT
jgi:hypothetical protein